MSKPPAGDRDDGYADLQADSVYEWAVYTSFASRVVAAVDYEAGDGGIHLIGEPDGSGTAYTVAFISHPCAIIRGKLLRPTSRQGNGQ